MSKKHGPPGDPPLLQIRTEPTGWTDALLICRKCSRKLDGGFGVDGAETLRKALRTTLRTTGRRGTMGLIEVACFGLCPKRAVTVARASRPGELKIVPAGADPAILVM